jgi:hypothetical protein
MEIKLNFINNSNDANNSQVVIFQKPPSTGFDEQALAWRVIQNCGQGDNHPFVFPLQMSVGSGDGDAYKLPQPPEDSGQPLKMAFDGAQWQLLAADGGSSSEVQVVKDLPQGAINASIYKDGKLLADDSLQSTPAAGMPEGKPSLLIGVAPQGSAGEAANATIVADINTEISLLGIASADIVMTGGGPGPEATPFTFTLENIVKR